MEVGSQPRTSVWVEVGVAVDDDQGDAGRVGEHRAQCGEFALEELARLVRRDAGQPVDALVNDPPEAWVIGEDQRRAGAAVGGVVHINGCVQGLVRSAHAIQFHRGTVDTPGRGALHQDGNPAGITSGPARIVNGNKRPRAAQHIKQMQTFVGLPGSGVRSLWA